MCCNSPFFAIKSNLVKYRIALFTNRSPYSAYSTSAHSYPHQRGIPSQSNREEKAIKSEVFLVDMAQLIIEPKKGKDGQIEFSVNYHDKKSDNSFTITMTNDLNEAVDKLKITLEGEVASMQQKK